MNSEERGPCRDIGIRIITNRNSKSLFNVLFDFPSTCKATGRQIFPFLDIFMLHPKFRINGRIVPLRRNDFLVPPLFALSMEIRVSLQGPNLPEFRRLLRGAEILLEAGADPNLRFPDLLAPVQLLKRSKRSDEEQFLAERPASASFHNELGKYWDEAIAALER